ncbi:MAG TPA: GntR family transcriptional regulator [Erysipelotrichaceae bacterium]|nr:GntR family transcriptional regulator [Erysipelotrichaceae bacterium]
MTSKYRVVAQSIEEDIASGLYKDAKKLPTEDVLIQKYKVSRNTVRKAIDMLVRRGIVMPIQGSGLFLRNVSTDGCINLENFHGLTAGFHKNNITSKVISFELIEADETIANYLQCELKTPIYAIERVRYIDEQPYVIEYSYYNKDVINYLNMEIINGSIYRYITEDLKMQIGYVDRVITADKLSKHDAEILGLNEGDPALISTNRAMLKSGVLFDYSIDIHNYKDTKFLKLSNFV